MSFNFANLHSHLSNLKKKSFYQISEIMSEIQQFYKDQSIFMTGGTGFFGKILVEKLLRVLPQIKNIYFLIRPKKGKEIQERMNELFNLAIFDTLKLEEPDFMKKIIPLCGDVAEPGLGLSDDDRKIVINEVSVVIHAAATTKFNEPLGEIVPINVNSTLEIIKLCRELKKLKAAVYVSTTFIRRNFGKIEEVVYSMPMTYEEVNNTVDIIKRQNLPKEDEEQFTKILLGDFPNTYVFSKSIAEGIINERARDLPFCIFRFPIATATYKEPVAGWVDTMQGFNLVLMGLALGIIHVVLFLNRKVILHMVPADFICNALIASVWETGNEKKRISDVNLTVYNYVTGKDNPLFATELENIGYRLIPYYCASKAVCFPFAFTVYSRKLFTILDFLFHRLPALIGDVVFRLIGRKPMFHKMYKKGMILLKSAEFVLMDNWNIDNKNMETLWKKLSNVDKELFFFDMTKLDWNDVLSEYWKGILKYILKDDLSPAGRQKAIRRYYKLLIIFRTLQAACLAFIMWLLWKLF